MKRFFAVTCLAASLAGRVAAQDAVARAAQLEAEENYKRLSATITEVQTAQEEQRTRVTAISGELDKLRSEVQKANMNSVLEEKIRSLADQIRKVDESRIADNKKLYEALEKVSKLIADRPVLPPPPRDPVVSPRSNDSSNGNSSSGNGTNGGRSGPSGKTTEEGFEYVIASGDRLDLIVKAYHTQNIMVSKKQIMDANPNVKWERLKIGQKIFIPKPK